MSTNRHTFRPLSESKGTAYEAHPTARMGFGGKFDLMLANFGMKRPPVKIPFVLATTGDAAECADGVSKKIEKRSFYEFV